MYLQIVAGLYVILINRDLFPVLILMVTFLGAQIAFWSTFFLINGGSFVGNIQIVIWTSVVCNCLGFFCLIYTDFWAFAKFELLMEKE